MLTSLMRTVGNALAEGYEGLKALSDAGLLGGTTIGGGVEILRRLVRFDLHPTAVWTLHAANMPDQPALVQGDRRLTWTEANRRINRLANGLRAIGVRPGDRVAYMLRNSIEWVESLAACSKIGASAVFVSYRSTAPEVRYLVENSGASVFLFHEEFTGIVREARRGLSLPEKNCIVVGTATDMPGYGDVMRLGSDEEPPADLRRRGGSRMIQYTSGTTGRPKGAVRDLSRAGIGSLIGLLRAIPLRRSDRHLVAAPLYHATGSGFATIHITLGATVHIMESFEPVEFLSIVDREKITTTALVPTMLRALLELPEEEKRKFDVSSLRVIVSTGSALPVKLEREVHRMFGEVLYDLYGSTEMGFVTVASPKDKQECPGTIGRPVPGTDVVLLSEDRKPVADGEVGELFARSQLTIEGYHGNPAATRDSRWGEYFSVGDLAVRDSRGYLKLVSRKSDMVISGGMNVYPAEIEDVLNRHPKVADSAVIGVPDEKWGESLLAFIVPGPGEDPRDEELIEHCRQFLAGYKVPRRFERTDRLPRNPTGKILKKDLQERVAE